MKLRKAIKKLQKLGPYGYMIRGCDAAADGHGFYITSDIWCLTVEDILTDWEVMGGSE